MNSIFETMAVINGRIRHLDLHQERLQRSCVHLAWPKPPRINSVVKTTLFDTQAYVCKFYYSKNGQSQTEYFPWPAYPEEWAHSGIECVICPQTLSSDTQHAGIKFTDRTLYNEATAYWEAQGVQEGLLCDQSGYLVEGTKTNLFWEHNGQLYTPAINTCGVRGTMRQHVIDLAKKRGERVIELQIRPSELNYADKIFLTNALIGKWYAKIRY